MRSLEEGELQELSRFLARRFPGVSARQPLAAAAGLNFEESGDGPAAWRSLLQAAQDRGRLGRLATEIARTRPRDATLQEVCALLGGTPPSRGSSLAAPLAFGSGVVCALAVFALIIGPEHATSAEPPPPSLVATRTSIPSQPHVSPAAAALRAASAEARRPEAVPVVARGSREGCSGAEGEIIGYFDAGAEPPGRAGQVIAIGEARNVRADYPGPHNRYDARTPVRCVLQRGWAVRLSAEPIAVTGARFWVPVYGGDVR